MIWKFLCDEACVTYRYTGLFCFSYFKRFPQHHRAFPPFKDIPADDLLDNKKFHAHCQGIMSTLNDAIDALDDIDLVDAILHTTGKRHGRRGQGRQEFIVSLSYF